MKIAQDLQQIDFRQQAKKDSVYLVIKSILEAHSISPGFHREVAIMKESSVEVAKMEEQQEKKSYEFILKLLTFWQDELKVKDLETSAVLIAKTIEELIHMIKISKTTININENRLTNELADMIQWYLFHE